MPKISDTELFKEIDLIQACIERMARNSFLVKGWAITLFVGVLAIFQKGILENLPLLIVVVIIPFFVFWLLDAFFLCTERRYRKLYQWVIQMRKDGSEEKQYDLDPLRFKNETGCSFYSSLFSMTLTVFFGIPILAAILTSVCLIGC